MRPLRKFLQLTRKTYPHGHERELVKYLPKGVKNDFFGNYYIQIGESRTLFTCHLDTADSTQKIVNHKFSQGYVTSDGSSILGADDKAGMTVMLYMIEKQVPGYYFFFLGEEVGCIGSSRLAKHLYNMFQNKKIDKYPFDRVVSFDRRGLNSVITHQMYGRCCSNDFAVELSKQLNDADPTFFYEPDNTGIMTDSAQFMEFIPECTNISVGYYDEHTYSESQDIEHLQNLCRAAVKVDWENLPTKRDPDAIEMFDDEIYEHDTYLTYGYYDSSKHKNSYEEFTRSNYATVVDAQGDTVKVYISKTWVQVEKKLIKDAVIEYYPDLKDIDWNGTTCWAIHKDGSMELVGDRCELINYVDDLDEIPVEHIKETLEL